jgi:hypothetical protein
MKNPFAALTALLLVVGSAHAPAQEPASACAVTAPVEADLPPSVRDLPSPGGRFWYTGPDRAVGAY